MSWLEKVDESYENYFKRIFTELSYHEYEQLDGNGMGAFCKYSNKNLKIQLLNDRGIMSFEVSKSFGKENFIEFELLMRNMISAKNDSSQMNEFEKTKAKKKRFSLEEQANFFRANNEEINKLFSIWNFRRTYRKIQ